jgi:glycosyltransferase involved in cell wall biosynthesis
MPLRPRLRVVLVSHSAALSGAERALARLASAMDSQRVEPVAILPDNGPLADELSRLGIPTRIEKTGWWIPATHWGPEEFLGQLEGLEGRCDRMAKTIREIGADLVHTNSVVTLEGAVAAARLGLPHVWHARGLFGHGFPPAYLDDVPFFLETIDALSDEIVCTSSAVERQLASHGGSAHRTIVADGFDPGPLLAQPRESREEVARRLALPPEGRWIVCLGGIQRRKGQRDLAEAVGMLRREFPNLVAVLAGDEADAAYAAELKAFLQSQGLAGAVRLVGFQREIRSLVSHAEMLVHPSHSEGFALAVLEAMALSVPVIATKSGGPQDIVEDGWSGVLVDVGNPAALARAIRDVLDDVPLAETLRAEGRTRAAQFTPEAGARRIETLYESLAHAPAIPRPRRDAAESAVREILARARAAASRGVRA